MNRESSSVPVAVASESSRNGRKVIRKAKKFSESGDSPARRKSLQMLQPVAGNQTKLVSSDGFIRLATQPSRTPKRKSTCDGRSQPKKVCRPDGTKGFTIFEDASQSSTSPKPKSSEQEAVAMMTQETPPETYWEELAETRRLALEDTLKENEQLHSENAQLKEENERLKVMADQAEYLADVVETLIGRKSSAESQSEENGPKAASSSDEEGADCRSSDESSPDPDSGDDQDDVFDGESTESGDGV